MNTRDQNTTQEHVTFADGHEMPRLGFGVFKVTPVETTEAVDHALASGYRSIDTAAIYGNEEQVGAAIAAGDLREEVFLTTKLWNSDQGHDRALSACEASLGRLGVDYVDLYLIHWPAAELDTYVETWQALIELRERGLATSIGVSNFQAEHLERLERETGVVPAINQIELHPYLQQAELRAYHDEHGIVTEAWGPLARGKALHEPAIEAIAAAHDRSPAQVVLRWHLQLGNVAIPKSTTPKRIEENFGVWDFVLDDEQMGMIEELDRGMRTGPDPDAFTGV